MLHYGCFAFEDKSSFRLGHEIFKLDRSGIEPFSSIRIDPLGVFVQESAKFRAFFQNVDNI